MYPRIRDLREDKDLTQTKLAQLHETRVDYLLGLTDKKNHILPVKNKGLAKFACLSLISLHIISIQNIEHLTWRHNKRLRRKML